MKIVHVCIGNYYADGFGYQENLLTKYNHIQGHDVVIITSTRNYDKSNGKIFLDRDGEYINEYGIKVIRLPYKFNRLGDKVQVAIGKVNSLKRQLDIEKPDLIFSHNINYLDILTVNEYIKKNKSCVHMADSHADSINTGRSFFSKHLLHGGIWRIIIRIIQNNVKIFYGVLPTRCNFLNKVYGVPRNKIKLLYMGADDECITNASHNVKNLRDKLGIGKEDFVIITGGQIDERKKIVELICTIKNLNISNVKLVIFGNLKDDVRERFNDVVDSEKIIYVGWKSQEEIYSLFQMSDLGVFPGTHSVLWEQACANGLPCIFKQWNGIEHVLVNDNCILMEDTSDKPLGNQIVELFEDKNRMFELKNNAIKYGKTRFLYSMISKQLIDDYIILQEERQKMIENVRK